jgi:hypothetical protein
LIIFIIALSSSCTHLACDSASPVFAICKFNNVGPRAETGFTTAVAKNVSAQEIANSSRWNIIQWSGISALGNTDLLMIWRVVDLHGDPASPSDVVKIVANQHVMISHQYVEAISTTK